MEEIVSKDAVWSYIAQETMDGNYSLREQARYYGGIIADEVVKGSLPVEDLRNCVAWAGRLVRESVDVVESEGHEALARRLLHSSSTIALRAVKTQARQAAHRADYRRRCYLVTSETNRGLFRLEERDLGLNGLVDLLGQVKLKEGKA
jgi:hypothetical protein